MTRATLASAKDLPTTAFSAARVSTAAAMLRRKLLIAVSPARPLFPRVLLLIGGRRTSVILLPTGPKPHGAAPLLPRQNRCVSLPPSLFELRRTGRFTHPTRYLLNASSKRARTSAGPRSIGDFCF